MRWKSLPVIIEDFATRGIFAVKGEKHFNRKHMVGIESESISEARLVSCEILPCSNQTMDLFRLEKLG